MAITTELIVPATLWTLVGFSVATWAIILVKAIAHFRLSRHNRRFTRRAIAPKFIALHQTL